MEQLSAMTDEQLALSYADGNNRAFDLLLSRNEERLFAYIMLVVHDEDVANDVFQETFVRAITRLQRGQYRAHGKFGWWLASIAHNVAVDMYRRLEYRQLVDVDDADFDLRPAEVPADGELLHAQLARDVGSLIDRLPPEQREVVHMRFYQELPFREIAELTHSNVNTCLGRMRYALHNLRKMARQRRLL